ncbi:MAG: TrkH family potassium uptake protein [bacterium]
MPSLFPEKKIRKSVNPALIISLSFSLTILAGAVLLFLPVSSRPGHAVPFLTALFTSTSAVCVTGLTVVDTGAHFSRFGQFIIMGLIEVGGLGIITFSTLFTLMFAERMSMKNRMITRDAMDDFDANRLGTLVKHILMYTFIIEFIGAAVMFSRFYPKYGLETGLFNSAFHAVSAFCNAGFSLFSNNYQGYKHDALFTVTNALLVIIGGIGFIVLLDLRQYLREKLKANPAIRLKYHSKIVLKVTAWLLLTGTVMIFLLEGNHTLTDMTVFEKIYNAFFLSASCRTAGFNTVPTGALLPATLFICTILMFIGASPGSTGGGIKTTTFAIIISSLKAMTYDKEHVVMNKKTISRKSVNKAITIAGTALFIVSSVTLILTIAERNNSLIAHHDFFLHIWFEVISAMGTVGLSAGVTPFLGSFSRIILIAVMFLGRVGPLTMALALSSNVTHVKIKYSEGRLTIG